MFEGYEARDDYIDELIRDKKASLEENHYASIDGPGVITALAIDQK